MMIFFYSVMLLVNATLFFLHFLRGQLIWSVCFCVGTVASILCIAELVQASPLDTQPSYTPKKPLLITVVELGGPYAAVNTDGNLWKQKIKEGTGLDVKVTRIVRRKYFAPELYTLNGWSTYKLYYRVYGWVKRQGFTNVVLLKGPPLKDTSDPANLGKRYLAGLAQICEPDRGFAMVNLTDASVEGKDKTYASAIVVAHELGHVCGAEHDLSKPYSIMHAYAAADGIITNPMHFSQNSINQMHGCLTRRGFYK
jgi:hypothetical protein